MKFLYAVVMLALAFGVEASVLPWAVHGWDDGQWHGDVYGPSAWNSPWGHHGAVITPGIGLAQGPVLGHYGAAAAVVHAPAVAVHAPAVAVHAPAVAVHAPAVAVHGVHGHEGSYVAQTRGAVHTAPLAGHVASVSSVNVAAAPGTV